MKNTEGLNPQELETLEKLLNKSDLTKEEVSHLLARKYYLTKEELRFVNEQIVPEEEVEVENVAEEETVEENVEEVVKPAKVKAKRKFLK